jgi:hypothetical protein
MVNFVAIIVLKNMPGLAPLAVPHMWYLGLCAVGCALWLYMDRNPPP